jgi:AMMECR1 domain-containing protein
METMAEEAYRFRTRRPAAPPVQAKELQVEDCDVQYLTIPAELEVKEKEF